MTEEELAEVERLSNEVVQGNAPVETRLMAQEEAIATGARALLAKNMAMKYGSSLWGVRTARAHAPFRWSFAAARMSGEPEISGSSASSRKAPWPPACAGSRRARRKAHESSSSRNPEPCAKSPRWFAPVGGSPARLAALIDERKRLERELADAKRKLAMGGGGDTAQPIIDVAGIKLFSRAVSGVEAKDLKGLVDDAKKLVGSGVVAIANASADGKAGVVVGVTDDLTARFNAVDFVRVASEKLGGKGGGGRPDLAQAAGPTRKRSTPRWPRSRRRCAPRPAYD